MVGLSHPYRTTGKTTALTIWTEEYKGEKGSQSSRNKFQTSLQEGVQSQHVLLSVNEKVGNERALLSPQQEEKSHVRTALTQAETFW